MAKSILFTVDPLAVVCTIYFGDDAGKQTLPLLFGIKVKYFKLQSKNC